MRISRRGAILTFLAALSCSTAACPLVAGAETTVASALGTPILPPGKPVEEMRAFIEPRIVRLPKYQDRAQWEQAAARLRRDMLEQVIFRGTPANWRGPARVEWLDTIAGGPGYSIRKFRYEALCGLWIPGLLYVPETLAGRVPLAVHVNGHAPEGKAVEYKQLRSINLAKRGMLVLNLEWFGMGQLRSSGFSHYRLNQLDLCGASGLAPFYLAMSRALDLGLALDHVDPKRVVVSGLSGGGWQTIVISSLDERVTLANPVAGYGSFRTNILFDDLGDSEQVPTDMATLADYTHLTALRAPRPTLLTYNATDDCCFKSGHTLEPLLDAARGIFALYGAEDRLRSHVNHVPGTHNFDQENREQLYAMIGDFFYPGDERYIRGEIPSTPEVKTAEALHVPLPEDNLDFHRLAKQLTAALPLSDLPGERPAAETWQHQGRERLKSLLKIPQVEAEAREEKPSPQDRRQVVSRQLAIGKDWSVPAVEIAPTEGAAKKTVLLVADSGRSGQAAEVQRWLDAGCRVLAADLLLWGESKVKAQDPDYLFPLFVAAVGERPLGIQAAQAAAIARWSRRARPDEPVTIVAVGPRSSAAALVAMAVEPAIEAAEVSGALTSFKQLIDEDKTVESLPELFAFGLLADFDVPRIVALSAPRQVQFREPSERASRDLAPLESFYRLFDASFSVPR